jgi:hypothetical protein
MLFSFSPESDLDIKKEGGDHILSTTWLKGDRCAYVNLVIVHKKQSHRVTMTSLSYIGQGILQTFALRLL